MWFRAVGAVVPKDNPYVKGMPDEIVPLKGITSMLFVLGAAHTLVGPDTASKHIAAPVAVLLEH